MRMILDPALAGPCVVVLGMFDGVHRGHQALLMKGYERAQALELPLNVCTFEPHPLRVLRPAAAPPLLTTLTERAQLMAGFGVDGFCITTFTRQTADESPETFLAALEKVYEPRAVVAGFNFTFGRMGRGDSSLLTAWGRGRGCEVCIVPAVRVDGEPVSSTRIRALLRAGDIRGASRLLGHSYTLSGRVMDGKHIGRTMGYPTANVDIPAGKALPAYGVYACYLDAEDRVYPAVVNVGRHPTLPAGAVTVEAHVLDACLMLYGKKVRLTFLDFQRPERRFDGVDDLKRQITLDAERARAYFASLR